MLCYSGWLKTILVSGGDMMNSPSSSTSTWALAVINFVLSCWGAYLAAVLLRSDSKGSDSPSPHLALAISTSVDTDSTMESDRRRILPSCPTLEPFMHHVDAFLGMSIFLLSTILNFGSVYLRGTYTGSRLQSLPETSSLAWTLIVIYSPSPLQMMYMASGMMNLVGLVSMYRWWRKERMGYTGIRPSLMEEGRSQDASDEKVVIII